MNFLTDEIERGVDWRAVERFVARFMSHHGWQSVRVVGSRGDGGGDVIGTRRESGRKKVFVVQVKAVTSPNYVGSGAIQEALSAMTSYGADVAVVATNGNFKQSAYDRRNELRLSGFDVRLWNGKFFEELLDKFPEAHAQCRELRSYQQDIVDRCVERFITGGPRAQFVVATGLGKTVIAAEMLRRLYHEEGLKRCLVLCHSQPLALQLEQSFWSQIGKTIPTRVFFDGSMPKSYDGINFGLYQTFNTYLNGILADDYDVVIVDEAHHALARGFRKCIRHLDPRFLVGMTATPWRGDGASIDSIFGPPLARVSLVDGMKMGYLARADYRIYCDTIDWELVSKETKGRISIRDLNKRLFVPQRDEAVVEELIKQCNDIKNPKVILFCASIEHCKRFAKLLSTTSPYKCKPLSGVDKIQRYKTLMEFSSGKIQAVTAVDVLNEGIDVPDVNILVFLRSTHSRRIFVQQMGRGLRVFPGKEKLLVLDFVTDVRRLAEVLEMDKEARKPLKEYEVMRFEEGIVTFMNEGARPFTEQWLQDVADLNDAEDAQFLKFPLPYYEHPGRS